MTVLVADADSPREGGAGRQVVDVAVGVLLRSNGEFLLTSRPPGKVYEGSRLQCNWNCWCRYQVLINLGGAILPFFYKTI